MRRFSWNTVRGAASGTVRAVLSRGGRQRIRLRIPLVGAAVWLGMLGAITAYGDKAPDTSSTALMASPLPLAQGVIGTSACGNGVLEAGEFCLEETPEIADDPAWPYGLNNESDIEVGRLNTGSNLDFVTTGTDCAGCSNDKWRLKLGNGAGDFTWTRSFNTANDIWIDDIEIIDANGDGRGDILADHEDDSVRIYWGLANNLWNTHYTLTVGPGIVQLGGADVTGGGPDAIIALRDTPDGDVMTVRQRNVDNTGWNNAYSRPLSGMAGALEPLDCDSDGDEDVIVLTSSTMHIFRAAASGTLNELTTIAIGGTGTTDHQLASGDFNEDGILDIVYRSNNELVRRLGTGGCFFGAGTASNVSAQALRAGDYDGDGHVDLIYWGLSWMQASVHFLHGLGNGTFSPPVSVTLDGGSALYYDLDVGDFNNDGAPDILLGGNGTGFGIFYSKP